MEHDHFAILTSSTNTLTADAMIAQAISRTTSMSLISISTAFNNAISVDHSSYHRYFFSSLR